jgi:tetratricopeptide (TPR) repeat protein
MIRGLGFKIVFVLCFLPLVGRGAGQAENGYVHAFTNYVTTKAEYRPNSTNADALIKLAAACADLADLATNHSQRASLAQEGMQAARKALEQAQTNAAAHFFLALNIGQLAQTKSLGALSLVKEMEQELLKAIEYGPGVEHGGPDRSLGMLYRDAPGAPFSIGSDSKAREHLQKAIQIAPDYPDNYLTLLESDLTWKNRQELHATMITYEKILPNARAKYTGPEWEQPWRDWEVRWQKIRRKAKAK